MAKILIVDDNDQLRMLFKVMLKEYEVFEASDGLEAIDICEKIIPNLILMDILMPKMDGIIATRKILEKKPDINIVAITAYSTRATEIIEAGAKEVLNKPIRKSALLNKIKEYVE